MYLCNGLFYLITILHSLILFLPFFCRSASSLISTLPPVTTSYLNHLLLVSSLCASLIPDHIISLGPTERVNQLSFPPCKVGQCRKECSAVVWRHLSGTSRNTVPFLNSASLVGLKTETMSLWPCKFCFLCYPCELLYLLQRGTWEIEQR